VAEGKYNVYLTPTDRAGNKGQSKVISVRVLNSVKNPTVNPALFWARDGDAIAATSALKARLTREATVSWIIRDRNGKIIRRGIPAEVRPAGDVRFVWNGKDDNGAWAPQGRYTARVRVTSDKGSYAHDVVLRHMPFQAYTPSWTRKRGDTITLKITTAEPLKAKPVVTANQPGIARYTVGPKRITKLSANQYKVVIKTKKAGKAGQMKVRVVGTDKQGGTNSKVFSLRLK